MSLELLVNERPSNADLGHFEKTFATESDRSVAIIAGALVEQALRMALCAQLPQLSVEQQQGWFDNPMAAFRSFEAKTKFGRALNIYDAGVEERIDVVRKIRNAFAHRALPLAFDHPALRSLIELINVRPDRVDIPQKVIFGVYAVALARVLRSVPPAELKVQVIT